MQQHHCTQGSADIPFIKALLARFDLHLGITNPGFCVGAAPLPWVPVAPGRAIITANHGISQSMEGRREKDARDAMRNKIKLVYLFS